MKQIGNAVCPKMAEALTAGYMRELAGNPPHSRRQGEEEDNRQQGTTAGGW